MPLCAAPCRPLQGRSCKYTSLLTLLSPCQRGCRRFESGNVLQIPVPFRLVRREGVVFGAPRPDRGPARAVSLYQAARFRPRRAHAISGTTSASSGPMPQVGPVVGALSKAPMWQPRLGAPAARRVVLTAGLVRATHACRERDETHGQEQRGGGFGDHRDVVQAKVIPARSCREVSNLQDGAGT